MRLIATLLSLVMIGCSVSDEQVSNENNTNSSGTNNPDTSNTHDAGEDVYWGSSDASAPNHPPGYCDTDRDCESLVCRNNHCEPAKPDDGVKNADETDVDCGGSKAYRCPLEKHCVKNTDCESNACRYDGVCISDRSCTSHFGGDTCGVGEVGSPEAQHENCCTRITIPSGAQVDKYKITAGRMRVMVEETQGDLRSWYLANREGLVNETVQQLDPFVDYLPTGMAGGDYTIDRQLGSWIWITDQPSKSQGCYIAGTGTHTYWMPPEVNAVYGDVAHGFSQDVLDTKPIQCLTMPMAMAFCAWDGGRLQTFEENKTIFGSARFPWGNAPEPGGYRTLNGVWTLAGPADLKFGTTAPACPTCLDNLINWTNNYEFPARNTAAPYDYSYWISAPGRFAMDKGPYGHMDTAGTLIEMTGTKAEYIDKQGRSPTYRWGLQGSWEGHEVGFDKYAFYFMVKYGKTGARCAR